MSEGWQTSEAFEACEINKTYLGKIKHNKVKQKMTANKAIRISCFHNCISALLVFLITMQNLSFIELLLLLLLLNYYYYYYYSKSYDIHCTITIILTNDISHVMAMIIHISYSYDYPIISFVMIIIENFDYYYYDYYMIPLNFK